jgi:hypothetical protein
MLTVTPVGTLLAWSATEALNPPEMVIVIGDPVAGPPAHIETGDAAESVKDGAALAFPVKIAKQTNNPAVSQRCMFVFLEFLQCCRSKSLISRPCSFTFKANSSTEYIILVTPKWSNARFAAFRLSLRMATE